jgi:hypothetical protein
VAWYVYVSIGWVVCAVLTLMFMRGAAKNNAIADKLAKEYFDNPDNSESK